MEASKSLIASFASGITRDRAAVQASITECLRRRSAGNMAEAKMIRQRLMLATARSDLPVGASCHCAQAAMRAVAAE